MANGLDRIRAGHADRRKAGGCSRKGGAMGGRANLPCPSVGVLVPPSHGYEDLEDTFNRQQAIPVGETDRQQAIPVGERIGSKPSQWITEWVMKRILNPSDPWRKEWVKGLSSRICDVMCDVLRGVLRLKKCCCRGKGGEQQPEQRATAAAGAASRSRSQSRSR